MNTFTFLKIIEQREQKLQRMMLICYVSMMGVVGNKKQSRHFKGFKALPIDYKAEKK